MIVIFLYPPLFAVPAAFWLTAATCAIIERAATRTILGSIIDRFVIFFIFRLSFIEGRDEWFDGPLCDGI
jgi:hypothetical protein